MASNPELKFLPSGAALAEFRVAASNRRLNQQTQQWEDAGSCFLTVKVWREMAENVAESLHQGDPVMVSGRLEEREYTNQQGEQRKVYEVTADAIGPGLRFASARVQRTQRQQQGQQGQPAQQQDDPWATPPPPQQPARPAQQQRQQPPPAQTGWQGAQYDEPQF